MRAAGSVSIQLRIAWMTRMSPSRVMTASPPGRSSLASAAIRRKVPSIHAPAASTWMIGGRLCTSWRAAGWSKRTAPQISVADAPPPP